jgi:hypothetical protein
VAGSPSPAAAHSRARLAGLASAGVPADDPRYDEARRDLAAALLNEHIQRVLAEAPPLTKQQRAELAELLRPIRVRRRAALLRPEQPEAPRFLVTKVAPALEPQQRVLYLGDWDRCGRQIEENTRAVLIEHSGLTDLRWERVALTEDQVREFDLPIISKLDRRYGEGRRGEYFEAVETEALGQARIVNIVRARLDELLLDMTGETIEVVEERERQERAAVAQVLEQLREGR